MRWISSTEAPDLEVGAEVAGFRLERQLGRGKDAVVYEATQLSLDRRVALKLVPADERRPGLARSLAWPDHPHVVSLYAVGNWPGGQFVAMRLVSGKSLARLAQSGRLDPSRSAQILGEVASALDAAHHAGIAHGAVNARNVFVDNGGQALLSDFGLGKDQATFEGDRRDFARLMEELLAERTPPIPDAGRHGAGELARVAQEAFPARSRGATRRRLFALGGVGVAALIGVTVLIVVGGDNEPEPAPPVTEGAITLGSQLDPSEIDTVDCRGQPPSGASQACTIAQTRLPGHEVVAPSSGAIRAWAVRGASGQLALAVIRRVDDGFVVPARSRYETVRGDGVHVMSANLPIRAGDHVGVQVTPGSAIGVRRGVSSAATVRWIGQLSRTARPIELGAETGFDDEILVRVDYVPGMRARVPGQLRGRRAARAAAGRELSTRNVEVRGDVRRVAVVELANAIVVDVFANGRRIARAPAPDADPAGRLLSFTAARGPFIRWGNPDGVTVSHAYTVGPRSLMLRG